MVARSPLDILLSGVGLRPAKALLAALAAVGSMLGWPCSGLPEEADASLPYTAYVTVEGAYYRSGPGANYYPTGKLPYGETVEVYRHDRGGWCAIRPPLGSFSWVSGKHIRLTEDRLGVVLDDDVLAAVGSSFSDIREVQQVRLDRGEEIEILEVLAGGPGSPDGPWYKIAPPAGEFRWVSREQISTEPLPPRSGGRAGRRNLLIDDEQQARVELERAVARGREGVADADAASLETRHKTLSTPRTAEVSGDDPERAEKRESLIDGWLRMGRAKQAAEGGGGPYPSTAAAGNPVRTGNDELTHELDLIDLELSHMVAEEPTAWSFDDLRTRADAALQQSSDSTQRARARLLVKRIKRFEDLRLRHTELADRERELEAAPAGRTARGAVPAGVRTSGTTTLGPLYNPAVPANQGPAGRFDTRSAPAAGARFDNRPPTARIAAAAAVPEKPAGTAAPVGDDRFDGLGKLTRVVSQKPGMPQYALVDDNGAVRQYVTAAPGVNLRRYVGHQVGVNGMKGYLPELNAHHVTAKRVTAMDGQVLR